MIVEDSTDGESFFTPAHGGPPSSVATASRYNSNTNNSNGHSITTPFNPMSGDVEMSNIKHAAEHEDLSILHEHSTVSSVYPLTPGPPPVITQSLLHDSVADINVRTCIYRQKH